MNTQNLKQKILDLAIKGQLVPQDSNDEPAAVLLEKIRAEKQELIKAKKIKKDKNASYITRDTIPYQQYTEHFADGTTKDITDQIPFDIPQNWAWCRLGEVGVSELGKTLNSNKDTGELTPYLCSINIHWTHINLEEVKKARFTKEEKEKYELSKNDLLICEGGDIGRCFVWNLPIPMYYQNALHRVRFYNEINPYFFKYVIEYYKNIHILDKYSKGVTIKHFTKTALHSICFPLPPLSEQQRIVAKVEELLALVATIETNKTDLATYIQQTKAKVLDRAVRGQLLAEQEVHNEHYHDAPFPIPKHWQWKKLGEIAQSNIGLTYKPIDISDDGIPILRSNNIQKNKLDLDDLVRVNGKIAEKNFIKKGDILICSRNGSRRLLGKCTLINEISEPLAFGAFMTICRSEINSWIFQVLQTEYFQRYLDDSNSTAINQITQKMLINFPIPLPPLSEQKAIVERIESIFEVLEDIETKLAPSPKGE